MTPLLISLLLLFSGWQAPQGLEKAEIATAIAAGERGEGIRPFVLGYGGAADPYVIGHAYPPEVRIAVAANAAKRSGRAIGVQDATPTLISPVVYIAVGSREKMAAITRSEPKAKPERLLILPKPAAALPDGVDADVVEDFASLVPGIPRDFDGRVFAVPAANWKERGYVVIFDEPALSTGGESGRERRCWVYGAAR